MPDLTRPTASSLMDNLTKNQKRVFEYLMAQNAPLSAYDILDALRAEGIRAPAQVYRALQSLQQQGLVHRLESLNAFVACNHDHGRETSIILAYCTDCGAVREFNNKVISGQLTDWAKQQQFKVEGAAVELRGHCRDCAGKSSL